MNATAGPMPLRRARRVNPPRLVVLTFAVTILAGTVLLTLPVSSRKGEATNLVDALFTATSATCVSGLTVLDIGTHFNFIGQVVTLTLIQAGGLGIMTMSTAFLLLLRRRLSIRNQLTMKSTFSRNPAGNLKSLIKSIVLVTLTIEFLCAAILYSHFRKAGAMPPHEALFSSIYHAISAFCNAGLSLYSDNLAPFKRDGVTLITIAFLIVMGGLGFSVIHNLLTYRFWKKNRIERGKLSLQTKTALIMSAILIIVMGLAIVALEWDRAMRDLSPAHKVLNAFFHAVTPRTAGFNTLGVGAMSYAVLFITICMMFIGASPGSTGGGIKTCTFAVLLATCRAIMRGKEEVCLMKREVNGRVVKEAICVSLMALGLVIAVCTLLLITEKDLFLLPPSRGPFMTLLFETVSAFGTVGLSTGITPHLSVAGKLLITLTMFVGRVGPLTLALIISHRGIGPSIHFAEEDVMIG